MEKSIAFFDFDGTVTTKDSMLELAKFNSGKFHYLLGMARISPWLVAMKIGLYSKSKAKEKFLRQFFRNTNAENFNANCSSFSEKIIPSLIKKEAMNAIQNHLQQNTPVVIVSASAENWIAPWCRKNNLSYICTQLALDGNKISGRLKGNNCSGEEKVTRIKELFKLEDYTNIFCYGDTKDDLKMLNLATHKYYRAFNK